MRLFRRRPKVRPDYRVYDASKMKGWGNNTHLWPKEQEVHWAMWATPRPVEGDILLVDGEARLITNVDHCRDPRDMCFFDALPLKKPPAPSTRQPSWTDGLVS